MFDHLKVGDRMEFRFDEADPWRVGTVRKIRSAECLLDNGDPANPDLATNGARVMGWVDSLADLRPLPRRRVVSWVLDPIVGLSVPICVVVERPLGVLRLPVEGLSAQTSAAIRMALADIERAPSVDRLPDSCGPFVVFGGES